MIASQAEVFDHYGIESHDRTRYEQLSQRMNLPLNAVVVAGEHDVVFHLFSGEKLQLSIKLHYPFPIDMLLHVLSIVSYFEATPSQDVHS